VIEARKAIFESNAEEQTMTTLEIVWRNPNPVRHHSRRRNCKRESNRTYYILEEFVVHRNLYYWTTISALEIVTGGRAA
jgi:hypothetical protein